MPDFCTVKYKTVFLDSYMPLWTLCITKKILCIKMCLYEYKLKKKISHSVRSFLKEIFRGFVSNNLGYALSFWTLFYFYELCIKHLIHLCMKDVELDKQKKNLKAHFLIHNIGMKYVLFL